MARRKSAAAVVTGNVQKMAAVFQEAEYAMLRQAAADTRKRIEDPSHEPRVEEVRQAFRDTMEHAHRQASSLMPVFLSEAQYTGAEQAVSDFIRDVGGGTADYETDVDTASLRRLAAEMQTNVRRAALSATRTAEDAYREVIAKSTPSVIVGEAARRKAAQRALDQFADRGITGFTDKAGRRWDLVSYVEMATRTQLLRTMVDAHVDKLTAEGYGLVIVSDIHRECGLCRSWEGKILAIDDQPGDRVEYDPLNDVETVVAVAGTLTEARLAGLFHPNCRHNIGLYVPGVTPPAEETTPDPEGDKANQTMRYYERQIRAWRRRKAVAISKPDRDKAHARIVAYEGALVALSKSSGVPRQRHREQITGKAR